jgi:UDP-N-acetyl-D-mannosaminuronic acid dehydrogenase
VTLVDIDAYAVATVNDGRLPFREDGAADRLAAAVEGGQVEATTRAAAIGGAECVIVVVGTPIDAHLSPNVEAVPRVVNDLADHLVDGQLLVLRSTVHPGGTKLVERVLLRSGRDVDLAFCPERIAEGFAMTELFSLPQIVAARTERAATRAEKLFRTLTERIVPLSPEEAELAKLFTNAWRYIKFAAANQFWMLANDSGTDFDRIRNAIGDGYPRANDLPGAGFAAGPCLLKDTMQLAAFDNHAFVLGYSALMVNESLPLYVVSRLERDHDLSTMSVGILGMAFKGGSDDPRGSLAYKLRKLLAVRAAETLCSDPYVVDDRFVSTEELLRRADLAVIGAPHSEYRALATDKPVADIWGITGRGVRI